MKWLVRLLVLAPVFVFLLATAPRNRSDADMAFDHARRVEQGVGQADPHFALYVPLMRAVYLPLRRLGVVDRAYPLLTTINAAFAAATVYLFFLFCYHRFSLRPLSSLFAAGFFLLSHGFWRYAAEAEPLVPASGLALGAFFLASRPDLSRRHAAAAGLAAGLALTMHYLSAVPALVMIPLYLAATGASRRIPVYFLGLAGCAASVLLALGLAGAFAAQPLWDLGAPSAAQAPMLAVRAAVGLGQCAVAGTALLGFDTVRLVLQGLFPYRMLGEEFFLATRISRAYAVFSVLTLGTTASLFVYGSLRVWRIRRGRRGGKDARFTIPGGRRVLSGVALWFLAHAVLTLGNQPGKPEIWLMATIPLWLLFCGLFVAPLARANKLWIVLALLIAFGAHNWIGGLRLLRDPDGDYNRRKAAWLVDEAGPDDAVVTAETPVFLRYLRYHGAAHVVDLHAADDADVDALTAWTGRVFVLYDVFDPPPSQAERFPEAAARARRYATRLAPHLVPISDGPMGPVYLLLRPVDASP